METHRGLVYSYKNDVVAPPCSWSFWMLHKSKKVWFRLEERWRGRNVEPAFYYNGRRIIHSQDLATLPLEQRKPLESDAIVWGQHVSNGWGHGPDRTNYYLHLWTRWSVLHPAYCHPERFTMTAHLPTEQTPHP